MPWPKGKPRSAEEKARIAAGVSKALADPQTYARYKSAYDAAKREPEHVASHQAAMARPEVREKLSRAARERMQAMTEDERRAYMAPAFTAGQQPAARRRANATRDAKSTERAKTGRRTALLWSTPEYRSTHKAAMARATVRLALAEAQRTAWAGYSDDQRAAMTKPAHDAIAARTQGTSIDAAVCRLLDALGVVDEPQARIGRYHVDVYVPDRALVIECDGCSWHSCPARGDVPVRRRSSDAVKDRYLERRALRVVRLWEHDSRSGAAEPLLTEALDGGDPGAVTAPASAQSSGCPDSAAQ